MVLLAVEKEGVKILYSSFSTFFFLLCYSLNVCVPSNSYVEALIPSVAVFEDGL